MIKSLLAISIVCCLAGTTQAEIFALGDLPGGAFNSIVSGVHGDMFNGPIGMSADGSSVVGQSSSANGLEAFLWTQAGGMVGLGDLPGAGFLSSATGVSDDGSVVVGQSRSANGLEAFRWTQAGGMVGLGSFLPGAGFRSYATGVSDDGSVVVGQSKSANGLEAFRWTQSDGMVGLGSLPGFPSGAKSRVSADGAVVVGYSGVPYRWTQAGGMVGLGDLPGGDFSSDVRDMSPDGSVIVGRGHSASGGEAYRWTQSGGMVALVICQGAVSVAEPPAYRTGNCW